MGVAPELYSEQRKNEMIGIKRGQKGVKSALDSLAIAKGVKSALDSLAIVSQEKGSNLLLTL